MSRRDMLDYEDKVFLGGRISKKHKIFQTLARLGFKEAEDYALLKFVRWIEDNPDASIWEILEQAILHLGQARMLQHTKELTRLAMIIGDPRKVVDW